MDQQDYQKLVKSSSSFKLLEAELQEKILAATGEEREEFIKNFQAELGIMVGLADNFNKETKGIMTSSEQDMRKLGEKGQQLQDENDLSTLLKKLN